MKIRIKTSILMKMMVKTKIYRNPEHPLISEANIIRILMMIMIIKNFSKEKRNYELENNITIKYSSFRENQPLNF
jgi:hypothetical protein